MPNIHEKRIYMPRNCCVPFCNTNSKKNKHLRFPRFPKKHEQKDHWIAKICRARKYCSLSQTTHVSAQCISVRWITQLAKMEKEKRLSWKMLLSCLFFKWSSKKRSWTTLASKGKHKGESSEEPRKKCWRKMCQQYDRKHGVIKKLHTGLQLKELGDKVQHYQTENQEREHAIAPWRMWILILVLPYYRKLTLHEIKVLEINAT